MTDLPPIGGLTAQLIDEYPTRNWWPAETSFEVMVGAILVQNTRWANVERALHRLRRANCLTADRIISCDPAQLLEMIRPAGCQSVKILRLVNLADWLERFGGFERIAITSTDELRNELLGIKGVGPETADAILNFACGRPVFVVDRYAERLFRRLGYLNGHAGPRAQPELRTLLEGIIGDDADRLQSLHAATVQHCQQICGREPSCSECQFSRTCRFPAGG